MVVGVRSAYDNLRVCACMWQSRSVLKNDLRITWAFQCSFFSDCLFIARLFNSPLLCFSKLFLFISILDIFQVCVLTMKKLCTLLGMAFSFLLVSLRQNYTSITSLVWFSFSYLSSSLVFIYLFAILCRN